MDGSKQILIIEDDIFLAEVLVNKLTASGFKAEVAKNGNEG